MKLKSKELARRFEFRNCLYCVQAERWVDEVIEGMENDTLLVFDPQDEDALSLVLDKDGMCDLLAKAKVPISIREWLCVGCQRIRFHLTDVDDYMEDEALAYYWSNGLRVLWPPYAEHDPVGPGGFYGEILVAAKMKDVILHDPLAEDKLKFIVAHELIHVFHNMRFVVPAFIDWDSFWNVVGGGGCSSDILANMTNDTHMFVDSYGEKNELVEIKEYWPSQAEKWFRASREDTEQVAP